MFRITLLLLGLYLVSFAAGCCHQNRCPPGYQQPGYQPGYEVPAY